MKPIQFPLQILGQQNLSNIRKQKATCQCIKFAKGILPNPATHVILALWHKARDVRGGSLASTNGKTERVAFITNEDALATSIEEKKTPNLEYNCVKTVHEGYGWLQRLWLNTKKLHDKWIATRIPRFVVTFALPWGNGEFGTRERAI